MDLFSWAEFFAGWIGGASGVVVGHPFDTVKVRMQTGVEKHSRMSTSSARIRAAAKQNYVNLFSPINNVSQHRSVSSIRTLFTASASTTPRKSNNSMLSVIIHMSRQEGWRSFYRGMSFPLLSAGVQNAIFFATYQGSLGFFGGGREKYVVSLENNNNSERNRATHYTSVYFAGCIAGAAQLGIAVPVDVVKIRLQVKTNTIQNRQFKQAVQTFLDISRREGWRALYRGTVPQAICMVPGFGVYFLAYCIGLDLCRLVDKNIAKEDRTWAVILAGGAAGMISWQSCLPFDVIKTKMQSGMQKPQKLCLPGSETTSRFSLFTRVEVLSVLRQIYREEGWHGLTRGWLPISLRAFTTNAAIFLLYELSFAYFSGKAMPPAA